MRIYSLCLVWMCVVPRVVSQETIDFNEFPPSNDLSWYPCNATNFCAVLKVPLDYMKPSLGQTYIPLVKIPAETSSPNGPYNGMIITNPRGPGDSGIADLVGGNGFGALYLKTIGTNYDLVSFDPRGTWASIPVATCNSNLTSRLLRRRRKLEIPALTESDFQHAFLKASQLGEECTSTIGLPTDAGSHMTTATVARDLVSIVEAFARTKPGKSVTNASLLNYWGFSYGSFIGETFASIFPDRVGRVVLDGIMDPEQYVTVGFGSKGLVATDDAWVNQVQSLIEPGSPIEWVAGIYCSDAGGISYNMTYDGLRHWISALEKESIIGGSNYALNRIRCTGWPIRGNEIFAGPFGGVPKNPILFVSNTLDPATPLPK